MKKFRRKIERLWLKFRGMNTTQLLVLNLYDSVMAAKVKGYDIYWIVEKSYVSCQRKMDKKTLTSIITKLYNNFELNNPPRKQVVKEIMSQVS